MQRSAGNQAVTTMLQDRVAAPPTAGSDVASGMPLDPATRRLMEWRLGHDFGTVRVHADEAAARSARRLEARAFTIGEDIVLGADAPPLHSKPAEGMLAHELTHVVQQRRGGSTPRLDPASAHEGVAAAAATAVMSGHAPAPVTQGTAIGAARQPTMDPKHARGYAGEQGMGFEVYPRSQGWIFIEGPSGTAGHGVTTSGFDGVAYNTRTGELHLVDNKSLKASGNVYSATAIDRSRSLPKNVDGLIARVRAARNVPGRIRILGLLLRTKTALAAGAPLPEGVTPVVTSIGGRTTDVSPRLRGLGVQHRGPTPPGPPPSGGAKPPAALPTAAPAATTAPPSPTRPPAPSGTGTRTSRPPGPGTRRPIRGGRFKPAVTTVEREADSAWRRMTRSSAAAIAKEAAPSTSRWAKAGRGLGKVAGVGFKAIGVVAPIAELMGGLAQIEEAKAMLSEIAKQQEEAYIAVMRDQGYEPVYRNGKLVDFKSVQPTPVTPAPSMEPTTGRVYSLRGQTLVSEQVRLSSGHEPITFASLTDEGSNVWDLSQPRRQFLTGYASRKDRAKLKGLAQMQAGILRMAHARSQQAASPTTEAPEAPAAVRGNLKIDFYWREGGAEKSIEAVCDNRSSPEGSWVASTLVGSVDELRAASRDQPLLDYEMDVLYTAADGSESSLHVVQSSSGNSVEKGDVPAGVLELGKYPDDSAVNFIIETYWYE